MKRRQFIAAASALPLLGCEKAHRIEDIQGGFTGVNVTRAHVLRDTQSWSAPATTRKTKIIIAGGGVAGLAAARALRLRGMHDFVLLELEDVAGGNSKGGTVSGIACPIGAHYLPVPREDSADARDVQNLLEEFGVRQRVAGRWQYDERYLCHSPQERLFFNEAWQDGLLPVQGVGAETLAQYRKFANLVATAQHTSRWVIPRSKSATASVDAGLFAITFAKYLDQNQLTDPHLRWYLDYCCRDDYGAGIATVSAWAGIHYFASRHGFHAPGAAHAESSSFSSRENVLTWTEGNGWLTQRMALPLGERLLTQRMVTRIETSKHGVEVDAINAQTQQIERWHAEQCIVALPIFIAARVLQNPPELLNRAAQQTRYAPWLVANIHITQALNDNAGAPLSWDNVLYGSAGLGYVNAKHQSLESVPAASVLTYYRAFGDEADARRQLLAKPWQVWRDEIVAELSAAHPDLLAKTSRIDITRYGHAMAVPTPFNAATNSLMPAYLLAMQLQNAEQTSAKNSRLYFAHSDWAGYSVFEEAFAMGHAVGSAV